METATARTQDGSKSEQREGPECVVRLTLTRREIAVLLVALAGLRQQAEKRGQRGTAETCRKLRAWLLRKL